MNKVFLIGRLTRDPELRYTSSNIAVATFSIAVDRNFSNAAVKEKQTLSILSYGVNKLKM